MDWMEPFWETVHIVFFVMVVLMLMEFVELYRLHRGHGNSFVLGGRDKPFLSILFSALIGFIPGCVGGLMVVSLYAHRAIGFGAVLAASFTALGDDAFRMLAIEPLFTLRMECLLFVLGVAVGFLCEKLFKFDRKQNTFSHNVEMHQHEWQNGHLFRIDEKQGFVRNMVAVFSNWSFARTLLVVILLAYLAVIFGNLHSPLDFEHIFFAILTLMSLGLVILANEHFLQEHLWHHLLKKHFPAIFLWTLGTLYFIALFRQNVDLQAWIENDLGRQFALLAAAIAIGWIPQSGPHFIFIQFYFTGMLPFGVFIANAIVQDGHTSLLLLSASRRRFVWLKLIKSAVALLIGGGLLVWG